MHWDGAIGRTRRSTSVRRMGDMSWSQSWLRELVRARPEVIYTLGPDATLAAAAATKTLPIVAIDLQFRPNFSRARREPRPAWA